MLSAVTRSGWLGAGLYGKSRPGMGCCIFLLKYVKMSGRIWAAECATRSMPTGLMSFRTLLRGVSGLFAGSFLLLCSILAALLYFNLFNACRLCAYSHFLELRDQCEQMVGISMFASPFEVLTSYISDTASSKLSGSQVDQRMFFEAAMRHLGKVLKRN